jgi:hypothetical protein
VKLHHLDGVSMCPPGGRLMDGRRPRGDPAAVGGAARFARARPGVVAPAVGR